MEEFIKYVLQFGHLNQQQLDLIMSKAVETAFKKEEYCGVR